MATKVVDRVIDESVSQLPLAAPLAVRHVENSTPLTQVPANIDTILLAAVEKGASIETMEKLVALRERIMAQQAKAAFTEARARFRALCPPIPRRTPNMQFKKMVPDRNGVPRERPSMYASIADIGATINAPLSECGLDYGWGNAELKDGQLTMACIVTHKDGHSAEATASFPVDSKAGCSEQQKRAIAMTYCQRYSLIGVLGLTTCDEDDDGNEPPNAGPTITEAQAADLGALADEVGADKAKFLRWLGVEKATDIPQSRFKEAIAALEKKRGGNK